MSWNKTGDVILEGDAENLRDLEILFDLKVRPPEPATRWQKFKAWIGRARVTVRHPFQVYRFKKAIRKIGRFVEDQNPVLSREFISKQSKVMDMIKNNPEIAVLRGPLIETSTDPHDPLD